MTAGFTEIADRVYVLRHPVLDVNVTLVLGGETALLVDTLSTPDQAAGLVRAVRALTALPWALANTHHHFDHCFGNATLAGSAPWPIYAHEETARLLREEPELIRQRAYQEMVETEPALAVELAETSILAPDHPVHRQVRLDLGGRTVTLLHPGRGHTAGDLVVRVPDVDVIVAGDLVEESGPPAFADSFPLEWPETVAQLLRMSSPQTLVVPGHGAVVRADFVTAQHMELTRLTWLIRDGHADGATAERVAAVAPFGPRTALDAIRRGYAELAGGT